MRVVLNVLCVRLRFTSPVFEVQTRDVISVTPPLVEPSNPPFLTPTSVLEVQSGDFLDPLRVTWAQYGSWVKSVDDNYLFKLIEDISMLSYHMIRSKDKVDATIAMVNFVKLRCEGPLLCTKHLTLLTDYYDKLIESMEPQSADHVFADIRGYLDKYDEVKNSPVFTKFYKFLMYALSLSLFDKVGVSFDNLRYSKMEAERIRDQHHVGLDFAHCMIDTITFICERGFQCMKTGQMDPIYHSGPRYEEWYSCTATLKRQALFLTNPEPHDLDRFKFLADLDDAIEKGEAIYKHAIRASQFERTTIRKILDDLKLIKSEQTSKRSAQGDRKAPFSVLVYGGSSVAKSTFTKLLFYHYGKVFGLSTQPEFKFTRNPADKYWTNFNTSQWCVVLDDIGFMSPSSAANGDPSLMEMLQVVNNVSFVPNQAALEDKGRTPVKSRFVIATTNTEHLNTVAYFACPLAVQRRLPYIIDISPKIEYEKDGCMLDGARVPEMEDNTYPDYWIIKVKRVVPASNVRENQRAKIVDVASFTDIYEFLSWFSKVAIEYETLQDKAMRCDKIMSSVVLCPKCHIPEHLCICLDVQTDDAIVVYNHAHVSSFMHQRDEELRRTNKYRKWAEFKETFCEIGHENGWFFTIFSSVWYMFFWLFLQSFIFRLFIIWTIGVDCFLYSFLNCAADPRTFRMLFRVMGKRVENKIGKHKLLIKIVGLLGTSFVAYKGLGFFFSMLSRKEKKFQAEGAVQSEPVSNSVGHAPSGICDERQNVWFKNDYQTTTFDVSSETTSWKSFTPEQLHTKFLRNCVHFRSRRIVDGKEVTRPTRAVCVGGHIYMCNNHALPLSEHFELVIVNSNAKDGVTPNITIQVSQSDIRRYETSDLAFIEIRNLPPRKDITKWFSTDTFDGVVKGYYLSLSENGSQQMQPVSCLKRTARFHFSDLNSTADTWFGYVKDTTQRGDCGAMLLAHTSFGPIILGIHYLGAPNGSVGAISITRSFVNKAIEDFGRIIVQEGEPVISAPSVLRSMVDLHRKSPVRYSAQGAAQVYGSFAGFRAKRGSKVTQTFICESMLKRGYTIKCGPPVMNSWRPWYLALQDMINPVTRIDNRILKECVDTFTHDIISALTLDALKQVHVYDVMTAVNGAPGVAYIDKINRNTSAGNPWKCSKKFFLKSIPPQGDLLDPVEVDKEIMDRVDDCITKYQNGVRYMPVYCGQLKDEAIVFKKIDAGKTRVFLSIPLESTITIRMYLLSVVRLVQNNRFIFESGPGTIAQSLEWQEIREFITQHGDERLIAGDYAKFDKRMPSGVILAAFDMVISICRAAGYTENELRVVQGIAEDTAFPLVDYNGDLIGFYGSNPSGHPLTVIINGLANSLYMRYTYAVLSPLKSCKDFKKHVALMTYGDDNCMGVSRDISFFNHTAIQRVLSDIDIVYTMADKEAPSIPFIHISEVSFLKRTWRWDEDVGAYLCPLEHDSIEKMLTMCVESKTISQEQQALEVIATAVREYFYYGKKVFTKRCTMLREVVEENDLQHYVCESTFPTWASLKNDFWRASEHVKLGKF